MTPSERDESICGVSCEAGPNGEPLACGFKKGHKGAHAWGSLPTFVAGRNTGPDSFRAGALAAADWLDNASVQPPEAKGHWGNAAALIRTLVERDQIKPEEAV